MSQNTRRDPRAKVLSMTVRYRSATLGEFIEHHSYDVSRGGMFIKTPSPFPPGTLLKFEVKISGEQRVMQGVGRVVWKRDRPSETTGEPAGMGIKFIKIDDASHAVIEKLLETRGAGNTGAFEHSPEGDGAAPMFPAADGPDGPAPEDRTVMKPASQLLDEALQKTGQAPLGTQGEQKEEAKLSVPALEASASAEPQKEPAPPLASTPATTAPAAAEAPPPEASERKGSSSGEERKSTAAVRSRQASKVADDEGGGGRAIFLLLMAALVMGGIFALTKRSQETPPEPVVTSAEPPQKVAPVPAPVETAPLVEPNLLDPDLTSESSSSAPSASSLNEPKVLPEEVAPSAVTSVTPPPPPVKPKPKAKAKPKPSSSSDGTSESTPPSSGTAAPEAPTSPAPASPSPELPSSGQ